MISNSKAVTVTIKGASIYILLMKRTNIQQQKKTKLTLGLWRNQKCASLWSTLKSLHLWARSLEKGWNCYKTSSKTPVGGWYLLLIFFKAKNIINYRYLIVSCKQGPQSWVQSVLTVLSMWWKVYLETVIINSFTTSKLERSQSPTAPQVGLWPIPFVLAQESSLPSTDQGLRRLG